MKRRKQYSIIQAQGFSSIFFRTAFWHFFRNIPCQKPVPPVYSIFIRFQPKRRKINPKEPPKTLSQEKSWNRVFLMEKREEKPKRNLKKGLTKPKTRHQRSEKKRKRDLKSEQKKRRGAERLSEKRIKKDSLLQPDYLDILWIKPSRFWQMKLRKKCQKRVRKDTTQSRETSIHAGYKQICLVIGNKMATFCDYSRDKNFIS